MRRRRGWWWRRRRIMLEHRPHMHSHVPTWPYHELPGLWKDNIAVETDKIIVTFVDMRPECFDMEKGLFDEEFHTLEW